MSDIGSIMIYRNIFPNTDQCNTFIHFKMV